MWIGTSFFWWFHAQLLQGFFGFYSFPMKGKWCLFIGKRMISCMCEFQIPNEWISSRIFWFESVWKPRWNVWILNNFKFFCIVWDVFSHDKQVYTCIYGPQVEFNMISNYMSRPKTEFILGQMELARQFYDFIFVKWSSHVIEHNVKRITSIVCLMWKLHELKVGEKSLQTRSSIRLTMWWTWFSA